MALTTADQSKSGRKRRGERGQSLVELAITLPVLLLLIVGIAEVGNGLNAYLTVVDAGRDGARLGAKGAASDDDIKNLVVTEMGRLPNEVDPAGDITVERNVVPGSSSIRVTVCYDHSTMLGLVVIPDTLRMCSTTTMPKLIPSGS